MKTHTHTHVLTQPCGEIPENVPGETAAPTKTTKTENESEKKQKAKHIDVSIPSLATLRVTAAL